MQLFTWGYILLFKILNFVEIWVLRDPKSIKKSSVNGQVMIDEKNRMI